MRYIIACRLLSAAALVALTMTIQATTPPPAPNVPATPGAPIPPQPAAQLRVPIFPSIDELMQMPLSGSVYRVALRAVRKHSRTANANPVGSSQDRRTAAEAILVGDFSPYKTTEYSEELPSGTFARLHTVANVSGSVQYTVTASNDSSQDVEPAVSALSYGGSDWVVTVNTKYVTTPRFGANCNRFHVSRSNGGAVPPTFSTPQALPNVTVSGVEQYKHMSDPYFATNPYASSGISPHTFYVSGILHQDLPSEASAVAVWRSTDGGAFWQGPATIASTLSAHFYDKPSIAVSYATSTLGRVFVAWVDATPNNNNFSGLKLARSCDGGATFPVIVDFAGPLFVHDPQVVVDNTNGRIYVIYVDHAHRQILMASFVDGTSCSDIPSLVATEAVTGTRELIALSEPANTQSLNCPYCVNGGTLRAISVPVARFNFAAHRIGVVWHERETAGATTADAYITTRSLNAGGTWTAPRRLTYSSTPSQEQVWSLRDQFMPTLDADGSGNWVTSFYNRNDDSGNIYYRPYFRAFSADGQTPLTNPSYMLTTIYDPASQPVDSGFVGDYQDIWEWTFAGGANRWNATWIRTSQSDNMVTGIQ